MFILVLPHKENKLHPIYRTIKSQDNFNKYQQHTKLWFAWKIVLLQYRKQRHSIQLNLYCRCDLLEKSYFCSIANNRLQFRSLTNMVVICLKNRTFAVSQTTHSVHILHRYLLWFAWKIVLLQYRKQHRELAVIRRFRCDLLEKSYFCSIANNASSTTLARWCVVICLENRTFAVSQTTKAFVWRIPRCCDLLEKSYFCSIANNFKPRPRSRLRLWFAWKIVLLQYRKQPEKTAWTRPIVVICLKNRTFAVSQTTTFHDAGISARLWFAWKIVLLQYRKQL